MFPGLDKEHSKRMFLAKRCLGLALSHRDAQTKEGRRGGIPPALPALELKLATHFGVVLSPATPPVAQQYVERQQPPQL